MVPSIADWTDLCYGERGARGSVNARPVPLLFGRRSPRSQSLRLQSPRSRAAQQELHRVHLEFFLNQPTSQGHPPTFVYPRFDVPWPLQQQSNIKVISAAGTWPSTSNYSDVGVGWGLMFTVVILIVASVSIIIVIFILPFTRVITYKGRGRLILHGSPDGPMNQRLRKLDYGANLLTGISFFFSV